MTNRTDAFTRADSASALGTPTDGGSAWVAHSGTWGISSNRGTAISTGATNIGAVLESSVADVEVSATISTVHTYPGLRARATNDANHILGTSSSGSGLIVYKCVAGSYTQLGSISSPVASSGDVLMLRLNGTSIKFLCNGVERVTATDSFNQTATLHGLNVYNDATSKFDDFSITSLAAAAASLVYYQPAMAPLLVR